MPSVSAGRSGWIVPCATWALSAALLAAAVLFDARLAHIGRSDLRTVAPETSVLLAGMVSTLVVGALLTVRRPDHPAGWLFLGLGLSMAVAGPIDGYATYGVLGRPGSLPGAAGAAHLGDVTFVPWLVLIAVILHLTPTGHPLNRAWGRLMWTTVVAGALAVLTGVFGERALDPPFEGVGNPWAIHTMAGVFGFVGFVATFVVGIGLIGASISMVVRYRRALELERAQLKWMYLAVVPLPLCVPAAFLSAWTGHPAPLLVATGGFVVVVPVAAGLANHALPPLRGRSHPEPGADIRPPVCGAHGDVRRGCAGRRTSLLLSRRFLGDRRGARNVRRRHHRFARSGSDPGWSRSPVQPAPLRGRPIYGVGAPGAGTGRDRRRPAPRGRRPDSHRRLLVGAARALDHRRRPAAVPIGKRCRRAARRPCHCPSQLRHRHGRPVNRRRGVQRRRVRARQHSAQGGRRRAARRGERIPCPHRRGADGRAATARTEPSRRCSATPPGPGDEPASSTAQRERRPTPRCAV